MLSKIEKSLILCVIFLITLSDLAFSKPKILVISSYNAEFQWDIDHYGALNETLGKNYDLEPFYMDTKRLPKDVHAKKAEEAWVKFQELKPVMVIISDDAALSFLGARFEAENKTPVVFLGINNDPRIYIKGHKNVTGILELPLFSRSIAQAKSILEFNNMPIKKVLVLFDVDRTSEVVKKIYGDMSFGGVSSEMKLIGKFDDWKSEINDIEKNGYDAVVIGLYQVVKDADGNSELPNTVLEWTSAHTKKPLFAFWSFSVGKSKAIGGLVLSGKEQGYVAGEMALKILGGADITKINPKAGEKGQFLMSKSELTKWKLKLPESIEKEVTFID